MQKITTVIAMVVSLGSINTAFADTQQPAKAASSNMPQQASTTTNITSTPDQVLTGAAVPTTPASNQGTLAQEHNLSDEEMD